MAESRAEYIERLELQLAQLDVRLYHSGIRVKEAADRFDLHVERRGSEERRRALSEKWDEQLARHKVIQDKYQDLQQKIQHLRGR